jgi:hypothetical protein
MLPLLLISGASFFIGLFIYYKNYYLAKNENHLRDQYLQLIHLLSGANSINEEIQGARNFRFRFQRNGTKHVYVLSEVDNRLIIAWSSESKKEGKRSHEWSFAKTEDQYKIYESVSSDIYAYSGQLISTF